MSSSISSPRTLLERLRDLPDDPLPSQLLRKYIGYAKKFVEPRLTKEACDVLHEFYLEMRAKRGEDGIPVTNRQLESLIRLCEARAKVELRNDATKADAEDVVEIVRYCIKQRHEAACGGSDGMMFDFVDLRHSGKMSRTKACTRFASILTQKAKENNTSIFDRAELLELARSSHLLNAETMTFETLMRLLSDQGFLLMSGGGKYRLTTVPAGMAK